MNGLENHPLARCIAQRGERTGEPLIDLSVVRRHEARQAHEKALALFNYGKPRRARVYSRRGGNPHIRTDGRDYGGGLGGYAIK